MNRLLSAGTAIPLMLVGCGQGERPAATSGTASPDVRAVSPALEVYRQTLVEGGLWQRPGLTPRDRSAVTLAALIARDQSSELARQIERALDNDLAPGEVSEIITHLAFYSGWGNAMGAVARAEEVFAERGIDTAQLPAASPELLPLDEEAEARRSAMVERSWGGVAPGVVRYTEEVLFRELWLRPALTPRDRSLVTVSALIAAGHVGQVPFHLDRAMANGLTATEASEVLTHLAFYAGWPNVFSALPVVGDVLERHGVEGVQRQQRDESSSIRDIRQEQRTMRIDRVGSRPSMAGPEDWFTGSVRVDFMFEAHEPARAGGASVTFEPGARTAWHTHPLGQTLIVTSGLGRVQREGGEIEEIRPGDVVWFEPGEKHWHGASPDTAMSHIAIQEQQDGTAVDWMEKVSDEDYEGR